MKHLRVFFIKNRLSKFGRLALHFILVNVDRVYDIVPIKRTELLKDRQEMLYGH